jgi:hypothetical protein
VSYEITVPPNPPATLTLPASGNDLMTAGAPAVRGENGTWTLAAGAYEFSFPASGIR